MAGHRDRSSARPRPAASTPPGTPSFEKGGVHEQVGTVKSEAVSSVEEARRHQGDPGGKVSVVRMDVVDFRRTQQNSKVSTKERMDYAAKTTRQRFVPLEEEPPPKIGKFGNASQQQHERAKTRPYANRLETDVDAR